MKNIYHGANTKFINLLDLLQNKNLWKNKYKIGYLLEIKNIFKIKKIKYISIKC